MATCSTAAESSVLDIINAADFCALLDQWGLSDPTKVAFKGTFLILVFLGIYQIKSSKTLYFLSFIDNRITTDM